MRRARFLALPLLCALTAGCVTKLIRMTSDNGPEDVPEAELSRYEHCSLRVCVLDQARSGFGGSVQNIVVNQLQTHFRSVRVVPDLESDAPCDAGLKFANIMNADSSDLYSAASAEPLAHFDANFLRVGNLVCRWLKTTEAGRALAAQTASRHPQTAVAAAPAPVIAPAPAAVASDVDEPAYRSPEDPHRFAVVVGIEEYSDLPKAQFAERDAAAVKKHLLALGFPERNIATLAGAKAGRAALAKYVEEWLPRMVEPDSEVFFYFSGHGAPDVKTGAAYLVPWDGDANFLATTAYPVQRLYGELGALKAKRVVVAMDTCFSGAGGRSVLAQGARPLVTQIDTGSVGSKKLIAFTASGASEISGTVADQGHGAFTYFFLKGLNGGAADASGHVSARGLYDYLTPKVRDAARRLNRDQTPQLLPAAAPDVVIR